MIAVMVDPTPIDIGAEYAAIAVDGAGGIATFAGLVRADDGVTALTLEHYPGATEAALVALAEAAAARWALSAARITHRVGRMVPGDTVVFVATAARHRAAALEACAFLIDRLKTDAPFWKKETLAGAERWVEPRDSDDAAAARWRP
ncbi:molybdenum cofactor biosynthesis protein MoaE [Sphingomonas sp. H39-1-10]|uniref:molybdenum cofactor biosynthesis protein MoaE n=1 Tax=Sphingomonas TaxID=13687 RepID=UPI0008886A11|nr:MULTISPECIES: molybdenum cofactor biosynthesis protein MoaE [Sphingomonas]MDF0489817.1 molybdenum cofactor biosynthesis protein MoaE [Sphingomonas pollutisoli]SDA31750.1 molybdopterin synthase catalytic subunit [Sphingomonas sp. NFR15]